MDRQTAADRLALWRRLGKNATAAAREIGITRSSMQHTLKWCSKNGLALDEAVMPGFEVAAVSTTYGKNGEVKGQSIQQKPEGGGAFNLPKGHEIKGVSTLVDGDGQVRAQWFKTREGALGGGLVESLREAFAEHEGMAPVEPEPIETSPDRLTFYPVTDLHLGMLAWHEETGESWDLKIAGKTLKRQFDELIAGGTTASGECIVAFMGDLLHQNDATNATPKSRHVLDVDGRFQKVLRAAAELCLHVIGRAAQRHAKVRVMVVPGNHDPEASVAVHLALSMFYSTHPRIAVDKECVGIAYHRHGVNLIGVTHGDKLAQDRMLAAMSHDRASDWGEAWCRRFYSGHIHHARVKAVGPLKCEAFSTPIARDTYAHNAGYRSERELVAIHFDAKLGEVGRHNIIVQPEQVPA